MGIYYLYANLTKRHYVAPGDLGQNMKRGGLFYGWSAPILAMLTVDCDDVGGFGELGGAWAGDKVVIASDESGPWDEFGVKTSSAQQPERNLYQMAEQEFENFTFKALASLLSASKTYLDEALEKARQSIKSSQCDHFLILAYAVQLTRLAPLMAVMQRAFGEDWIKQADQLRSAERKANPWRAEPWI